MKTKRISKGHNFEHRNLYNNDLFTVNIIREPKENDIVMDLNYKLWEVKSIENGLYNLTRKDRQSRYYPEENMDITDIWNVIDNYYLNKDIIRKLLRYIKDNNLAKKR